MIRKFAVIACIALTGALASSHAANNPATSVNLEVAPPGAALAGWAFTAVDVVKAAPFVYVNADPIASHNVVVYDSHNIEVATSGSTVAAGGYATIDTSKLVVGQTYKFVCVLHSNMKGTITVQA